MSTPQQLSDFCGTEDFRYSTFGATLIDTNPDSGYDGECMLENTYDKYMTLAGSLSLYPSVYNVQKETGDEGPAFCGTWINCFAPFNVSIKREAKNMQKRTFNATFKHRVVTTDQHFQTRKEDDLNSVFSCLRVYNGPRIVDEGSVSKKKFETFALQRGLVSPTWRKDPISVRWVVSERGDEDIPDYFYFIGGSEEICEPEKIIKKIQSLASKVGDRITDVMEEKIWDKNSDLDKSTKELARLLSGSILVRNYLVWAKNEIGVKELYELDGDTELKDSKKVSIDSIIDRFEEPYQYIKSCVHILKVFTSDK